MKKRSVVLFLMVLAFVMYDKNIAAQSTIPADTAAVAIDYPAKDTIRKKSKLHHSFFIQADGSFYSMLGKPAAFTEFNINWLINKKYYIGAKCQLLSSKIDIQKKLYYETAAVYPSHVCALLNLGIIFFQQKKFSLNPELSLGWANLKFHSSTAKVTNNYGCGVLAINGVWNAHKNIRIGIGVGGKVVIGQRYEGLKAYEMSGGFGHIFIRVGKF